MECLVNLLCTLLITSVSIKNNVSQILLRTTDFQNSYWDILIILIIVIFAVGILALCDLAFLEEDRRYRKKTASTEPEKKWISCDSVKSTNTNNSRIIQDMHKIASPINVLGKQMGDLEKVTTFISTLIEEGIKNFSFEGLSKAQQLEIFLFDACMAKNLLLAKEKIPNVYVPKIDKTINSAYRDLKDKLGTKMDEFLETACIGRYQKCGQLTG